MRPFQQDAHLLGTMPGIQEQIAAALVAEIGSDMSVFPSAEHLSAWAGLCSGNNQTAGKRNSGKTAKGNRWLRRSLCQAARSASHAKQTYLSARFRRLAARRGKTRATVAVAHTILVIAYHVLNNLLPCRELGPDHFDRLQLERIKRALVRRLQSLGYQVQIQPAVNAA